VSYRPPGSAPPRWASPDDCGEAQRGGAEPGGLYETPAGECHGVFPLDCCGSVNRVLGGVGLLRRLRPVESLDFHAFAENAHGRRHACSLDIEELRAENLGNQADVRDRRRIAVAEPARFAFLSQMAF